MEQSNLSGQLPVIEQETEKSKKLFWFFVEKNFLALSILAAGVMISGSLLYTNGSLNTKSGTTQIKTNEQGNVKVDVSIDDDPFLGDKNAKVIIVEFSDYQCPFCRSFWKDSFVQLKKEYIDTNKIKFVYRDYPLSFHPMAQPFAEAAECAEDQGKYWQMHDKIFSEQEKKGQGTVTSSIDDLKLWASQVAGLDKNKFNQCLDSGKYKVEVQKDFDDGSKAGVSGTPSFFINGRLLVGAQPFSAFKSVIDEELNKK